MINLSEDVCIKCDEVTLILCTECPLKAQCGVLLLLTGLEKEEKNTSCCALLGC